MPLPTAWRSGRTKVGIETLLFHTLLLVPQQDRRDKWSQGTTKLLRSPESGMDREAQPHSGVLNCTTCRSQGFSFPQTHPEHNTIAPQTQPSLVVPALLLTPVPRYTVHSARKGWSASQQLGPPFSGCPPHLQRAQSAGRELIWSPALAGSLLRTCYAVALANIWLWAPAPQSDGSWWERRGGWRQCGQRSHARLPLPECVPGVLPSPALAQLLTS